MGEVKDAVKGTGPSRKKNPIDANLTDQARTFAAELSRLTVIKDDDVLSEGEGERPENIRKAAQLRAAHALMTHVIALLEDY